MSTDANKLKLHEKLKKVWHHRNNSMTSKSPEIRRLFPNVASISQPIQERSNENVQHQKSTGAEKFHVNGEAFFNTANNVTLDITNKGILGTTSRSAVSMSDILMCPSPSQHFVGQEDTLEQLSKLFSATFVAVWGINSYILGSFIERLSMLRNTIFLDASSAESLTKSIEGVINPLPPNFLLVFVNTNTSLAIEEQIPARFPRIPVIVTSTNRSITSWASTTHAFELTELNSQQDLWSSIEKALEPRQNIVSLVASGGTGKTQVALEFVEKMKSRFSYIWFFDGSSHATLVADFQKLGKAIGVGEEVEKVKGYLSRSYHNWLCIFDSADDPNMSLHDYVPSCKHGNIIITSQLMEISQMDGVDWHNKVEDLNKKDATSLLLELTHSEDSLTNQEWATEIVQALDCHALAVVTAGAYIYANARCTLDHYLDIYNKKQKYVVKYRASLDKCLQTILGAFELSFERLSKPTQYLLQVCSYLHPTVIPIELFQRAATFTGSVINSSVDLDPPTEALKLVEEFLQLFTNGWLWEDSINELSKFSLVVYDSANRCLALHSVIQSCAQQTVEQKNNTFMRQVAMILLGCATPLGMTKADHEFRNVLLIHAIHYQENNLPTLYIKLCIATIFESGSFFQKAENLRNQIVAAHVQILGKHHADTIYSMSKLAFSYLHLKQYEAAEKLEEEVLMLRKQILGEHHPDTLLSMENLALLYSKLEKLEAAEKLDKEVLMLRKQILGEHHPDTLLSMANLALSYFELEKLEAAEKLEEEVLMLRKQILGKHHPDTLLSMTNLALSYSELEKFEAAKKLNEEILELHKQILGEHHPETLHSMANLALSYSQLKKFESAEKLEEEVLMLRKQNLGEHHPDTLLSMENLALLYTQLKKYESAMKLEEEVLILRKHILGKHHPDTLLSMENLALLYTQLKKVESAIKLEEEVSMLHKQLLEEPHQDTLLSICNLVDIYKNLQKFDAAEQLEGELVLLHKQILGEHHTNTLNFMENLASSYCKLEKWQAAEELQKEVLVFRKQILVKQHPYTSHSMAALSITYRGLAKIKLAKHSAATGQLGAGSGKRFSTLSLSSPTFG